MVSISEQQELLEEERQEVREQLLRFMKTIHIIAYISLFVTITAILYPPMQYATISVSILIIYSTWKLGKAIKQKQSEAKENETGIRTNT